jgi:hypothetical protein
MDRSSESNSPLNVLRDGRLKATVWENEGENGTYHTVTLAKIYEDNNGKLQETNSFSGGELLRIAELAREAHSYVRDLRREVAVERKAETRAEPNGPFREERPRRFRGVAKPGMER